MGKPVRTLAYPCNNQSRRVRRLARDEGYVGAVMGLNTTLMSLRAEIERTPVWPF